MRINPITKKTVQLVTPFANVGLYYSGISEVVLIDSGHIHASKDLLDFFLDKGIEVKAIINTHGHIDHVGGNFILQAYFKCPIIMPYIDHIYCEDISRYYLSFSTSVIEGLNVYGDGTFDVTTHLKDETSLEIEGGTFEFRPLKGHTANQKAIVTPDGVCFLGDGLMAEDTLDKSKFAVVTDLYQHHASLEKIKSFDDDYYVLGHGEKVYLKEEMIALCDLNHAYFDSKCDAVLSLVNEGLSFDPIMAALNKSYGLKRNIFKYFVAERSIKAMLSYLEMTGKIEIKVRDGMLTYSAI